VRERERERESGLLSVGGGGNGIRAWLLMSSSSLLFFFFHGGCNTVYILTDGVREGEEGGRKRRVMAAPV
jgi:hypothetical protein